VGFSPTARKRAPLTSDDWGKADLMRASFQKGLAEAAYVENRNVAFELRWADGQFEARSRWAETESHPLPHLFWVGVPIYSGTKKKLGRLNMGGMDIMRRHWLDYDPVALAVLIIGMGIVELLALIIWKSPPVPSSAVLREPKRHGTAAAFRNAAHFLDSPSSPFCQIPGVA
jgi:hypothetical protein